MERLFRWIYSWMVMTMKLATNSSQLRPSNCQTQPDNSQQSNTTSTNQPVSRLQNEATCEVNNPRHYHSSGYPKLSSDESNLLIIKYAEYRGNKERLFHDPDIRRILIGRTETFLSRTFRIWKLTIEKWEHTPEEHVRIVDKDVELLFEIIG